MIVSTTNLDPSVVPFTPTSNSTFTSLEAPSTISTTALVTLVSPTTLISAPSTSSTETTASLASPDVYPCLFTFILHLSPVKVISFITSLSVTSTQSISTSHSSPETVKKVTTLSTAVKNLTLDNFTESLDITIVVPVCPKLNVGLESPTPKPITSIPSTSNVTLVPVVV